MAKTLEERVAEAEAAESKENGNAENHDNGARDDAPDDVSSDAGAVASGNPPGDGYQAGSGREDDADGENSESEGEGASSAVDTAAAVAAFEAGDMRALAEALGKSGAQGDVSPAKFRAMRATQKKLDSDRAQIADQVKQLQERYGDPYAIKQAWKQGNAADVATYIKRLTGADWSEITLALAGDEKATPKGTETERMERELAEVKRLWQEDLARAEAVKQEEKAVKRLAREMREHPYVKDEDDAREIIKLANSKYWDPEARRYTKTRRQIADILLERERARARKRGFVSDDPKPGGSPTLPPERTPPPRSTQRPPGARAPLADRVALAAREAAKKGGY